jgi:hypothetical protein
MLLRVGLLTLVTGAVFVAMAWLDPAGPLAIIIGSGCCAVALEAKLDVDDLRAPLPRTVPVADAEETARGAAA